MRNLVDVIVVNWNAGDQLRACVDSIAKYGAGLVGKVIVVDNGSVDGSTAGIEELSNVTLVLAGSNLGFGKACNLGAKQATSKYLLFLNPDAALYESTLPKCLEYMESPENLNVGICGAQMLDQNGAISRSCARFPSVMGFFAHAIGLNRFFPRLSHFMGEWSHEYTRQVDHVIGAFYLIRHNLFKELEGFDERFFVYLEELDLSLRAAFKGWSITYLSEAKAFHLGGGTSSQVKGRRLFYSQRSRLLYAFKHFSGLGAFSVLCLTFFVEPISRSTLALMRLSWSNFREIWSAYGMLWRWLPKWAFHGITR